MKDFNGIQDLFHVIVKKAYCVYNEEKGTHLMKGLGFEFGKRNPCVHLTGLPAALVVMIRCGVKEETVSLYCKKLTDLVSCFGEEHKNLLSFCLVEDFLLQYFRVEDDNKEVFWRCFKTLLQDTDFKVNSRVMRSIIAYEKELFNEEYLYLESKQHAFIFSFLYFFQLISYDPPPRYYISPDAEGDILICILTELITEYGLDIEALDCGSRGLCEVLSACIAR